MTNTEPAPDLDAGTRGAEGLPVIDVLVVGAGPTGLTAAAEALRLGLSVRIVERRRERGAFSKALVVHARTMEVFAIMSIDQKIRARGTPFAALNLHFNNRKRRVRVDLLKQPWGDTAYPYWLSVPQYETEQVLEARLNELGGRVEWSCALTTLDDRGEFVEAQLASEHGNETVHARWVIGADGGRSTVREQAGITLTRTGADARFLLADVKTTTTLVENEGHMFLAPEGLFILVPMPTPTQWRVIAHVASAADAAPSAIDTASLDTLIAERAGISFGSHDITWTSQFDLSHGVAERFRSGRIFLAGDAAHIHSPVGGQGLNTGVQDAHNLLWRLAESRTLPAGRVEELLAAYETERRTSATTMVGGVARITAFMTSRSFLARRIRSVVAPLVISRSFVQAKLARGVGMLNLACERRGSKRRGSKRRGSKRYAGNWRVGSRLPNPILERGDRLYDRLPSQGYFWVVTGNAAVGGPPGGLVLVRPDRYIAAVGSSPENLRPASRP